MAINPIGARIPQPGVPFIAPDGGLSREWLYYMIAMLNRTGGNVGISTAAVQKQTQNQGIEAAFADVGFPAPPLSLGVLLGQAMADTPPSTPLALGVLLGQAMADDTAPPVSGGQYITNTQSVSLSSSTTAAVVSIPLTAGDWDVWGTAQFIPDVTTTVAAITSCIALTPATLPVTLSDDFGSYTSLSASFTTGQTQAIPAGHARVSLGAAASLYLNANAIFAVSTMTATGFIAARRTR